MLDVTRPVSQISFNNNKNTPPLALQERNITPTTEEQIIVGDDGYNLSKVVVSAVTKDIDENIQGGNIKAGVSILGVEGVLEGNKLPDVLNKTVTSLTAGDFIGVTQIPNYVFQNCTSLASVELPDTITSIGERSFFGCSSLTTINLPEGLTEIGNSAFRSCGSLTDIVLPDTLKTIGSYAFQNCVSISGTLNIPASVTSIGSSTFAYCSGLTSIILSENITELPYRSFEYCSSLTTFNIPNSVTTIGGDALQLCSALTSIIIPSSVTSIGTAAFNGCTGLNTVIFQGQVPNIQSSAFRLCDHVTKYDFRNCTIVPTLANTYSLDHANNCQIIVPDALYDEWTQATNWVALTNVVWVKASEYTEEV